MRGRVIDARIAQTRLVIKLFLAFAWRGRPAGFRAFFRRALSVLILFTPQFALSTPGPLGGADGSRPACAAGSLRGAEFAEAARPVEIPSPLAQEGGDSAAGAVLGSGRVFLWVIRDALEDTLALAAVVDSARSIGCTDLLVQVRGRGEAYYRSSIEPAPRSLETGRPTGTPAGERPSQDALRFDPLAAAIRIARDRGMRLHAWVNVFLSGSWSGNGPRNVVVRHPDWTASLEDGRSLDTLPSWRQIRARPEGIFLSPGNPEVLPYILKVVREIVSRYPLDGLHLDYIRYPHADAGYDEASREAFLIADLEESIPRGDDPHMDAWDRWRMEQVSRAVEAIAGIARAARPGIELTAAVLPEPTVARRTCKQDWPRWIREGWLDRVFPMAYTASTEKFDSWLRADLGQVTDPSQIVPGVGLHKLDVPSLEGQLGAIEASRMGSYALFSHVELMKKRSLREAIRRLGGIEWQSFRRSLPR